MSTADSDWIDPSNRVFWSCEGVNEVNRGERVLSRPGSSPLGLREESYLALGVLALSGGCLWIAFSSLYWFQTQRFVVGQQVAIDAVTLFFVEEALAVALAMFGSLSVLRGLALGGGHAPGSVRGAFSEALNNRREVMIGVIAGSLYGIGYLFLSSIVVYQPGVTFQQAGVTAAACCGSPGTVPELVMVLSQTGHLAIQLLPLDLVFAAMIPLLVGLNAAVASHAVRNNALRSNARWLGPVGVVTGLFTGCPTCAGLFLAGTVGGVGATTLAVALAPYQLVMVAVTIPVLVVSPYLMAVLAARAERASCAVPGVTGVPRVG